MVCNLLSLVLLCVYGSKNAPTLGYMTGKGGVPTDLSPLLVKPVHGAAQLSEHCAEKGAACQDAVRCLTQQQSLHLLRPHTHPCGVKVRRVLCQPLSGQLGQSVRGDHVCCCAFGWRHSETCVWAENIVSVDMCHYPEDK